MKIEDHNEIYRMGGVSFEMGINRFADLVCLFSIKVQRKSDDLQSFQKLKKRNGFRRSFGDRTRKNGSTFLVPLNVNVSQFHLFLERSWLLEWIWWFEIRKKTKIIPSPIFVFFLLLPWLEILMHWYIGTSFADPWKHRLERARPRGGCEGPGWLRKLLGILCNGLAGRAAHEEDRPDGLPVRAEPHRLLQTIRKQRLWRRTDGVRLHLYQGESRNRHRG